MSSLPADSLRGALASRAVRPRGAAFDPIFGFLCGAAATALLSALALVIGSLLIGGWPAFQKAGLSFFTSSSWNPVTENYGGFGPIVGTLITAFVALLIALPIAFCVAVELLAGVPSIVYGMWGLFVFAPVFANWVELPLMSMAPPGSVWEKIFSGVPNGSGILSASIILAVMILPYIAATLRELFLTVPAKVRESAYGVGCTPLEVVWSVTLPYVSRSAVGR